jgi:hypothetical protein
MVRLLERGGRFDEDGKTFAMASDGSLVLVLQDDCGDEYGMKVHTDISELKRIADAMGHDELWLMNCTMSLQKARTRATMGEQKPSPYEGVSTDSREQWVYRRVMRVLRQLRRRHGRECVHKLASICSAIHASQEEVVLALDRLEKEGWVFRLDDCYRLN